MIEDNKINKILLVDDEEGIRKVLGITLLDMGYQVFSAENGKQALELFKKHRPAIVLTDIKMPGMDGIEVLKRIKQESPDTEVIVITGHGDMDLAIKSLKYDATDFITKPINDDELEKALQKSRNKIFLRQKLKDYTENLEMLVQQKTERLARASAAGDDQKEDTGYGRLFEQMPGYVAVMDEHYRLTAANRQFKHDFQIDETVNRPCYEILKREKNPCADCPVQNTFKTGKSQNTDMEYVGRKNDRFKVITWTTPLRDKNGSITQVMLMATDISQVLDLQDHLSSLGLMIGSVSHGIKGLLTGLDGGVYLLDSGFSKDDPDKINEGLDIVKLMVGRIKSMVLDILYYTKERDLNLDPMDVTEFCEDIASVAKAKMKPVNIQFQTRFDPNLESVQLNADKDQLQTAFVNIFDNAVDACAEDKKTGGHTICFGAEYKDNTVKFEITDNGTGMTPEVKEKMFTLFFSSKATKGTGIGLFVTNKIIRQHDGTIDVESEDGKGTTFVITIPVSQVKAADD